MNKIFRLFRKTEPLRKPLVITDAYFTYSQRLPFVFDVLNNCSDYCTALKKLASDTDQGFLIPSLDQSHVAIKNIELALISGSVSITCDSPDTEVLAFTERLNQLSDNLLNQLRLFNDLLREMLPDASEVEAGMYALADLERYEEAAKFRDALTFLKTK